jgi:hypothetical protein
MLESGSRPAHQDDTAKQKQGDSVLPVNVFEPMPIREFTLYK